MAERTLSKIRDPRIPTVIYRPSIIISSYREPYPGWTDTLSAAGGLSLAGSVGILHYVHGDPQIKSDLVPVDMTTNQIIVCTAMEAFKPKLTVMHGTTSHKNPLPW